MTYFATTAQSSAPELPVPTGVQLWPDGEGGHTLVWQRPLGRTDGFVILHGPEPLSWQEVARVGVRLLCWQVPPDTVGYLAVACIRGGQVGTASAAVFLAPPPAAVEQAVSVDIVAPTGAEHAPYGRCACCQPPRPLLPLAGALACPQTAAFHVLLGGGVALLVAELPYGLCLCCDPQQPLIRCGEEVVCYARPDQVYTRQGECWRPAAPLPTTAALADVDAIDAALRANSALLGVNGLFVG